MLRTGFISLWLRISTILFANAVMQLGLHKLP